MLDLAVIVLNYRTAALTLDCLASLEGEIVPGIGVLVVDNASGDGSAEQIERAIAERWSAWASLLRSPLNGGFAAGNNLGIRAVEARAYVLLNSDTRVRPGAMAELIRAMHSRPDAGIIGAGLLTGEGGADASHFRATAPLSEFVRGANTGVVTRLLRRFEPAMPATEEPCEADWVGFACALIRRETFEKVGLLDDGYFMYFEDLDFCRRARATGLSVLYWPRSKVVHLHGGSSRLTEESGWRKRAPRYYYEARSRYFAKFYGRPGLWAANLLWLAGRTISLLRETAGRVPTHREREALDIWTNAADPLRPRHGASS